MQDQGSLSVMGWRFLLPTPSKYPAIASPSITYHVSPLSEHRPCLMNLPQTLASSRKSLTSCQMPPDIPVFQFHPSSWESRKKFLFCLCSSDRFSVRRQMGEEKLLWEPQFYPNSSHASYGKGRTHAHMCKVIFLEFPTSHLILATFSLTDTGHSP